MALEVIPAHDLLLADQAKTFTEAFAGYVGGSFEMDAAGLARFISLQGADICHSRFVRTAEGLAGFAYVNRTADISRIGGMGVVPEARRSGVARHLLRHLIEEAQSRGDQAMILEVIEQNPAAHALYASEGFQEVDHLGSWRRPAGPTGWEPSEALRDVPLIQVSQLPSALEYPNIPWPISRHAMTKAAIGHAFRSDNGLIVTGDLEVTPVRLYLFSCPSTHEMDWNALRDALGALLRLYPDHEFFCPAVFPDRFGEEIFQPLGFARDPLNQFLMRKNLP